MRILRATPVAVALAMAVAACTSGGGGTPAPTQAPTAAPSAAASSAAGGGVTIDIADSSLGKILADGAGRTLYAFTADSNGTSACSGSCVDNWPPLTSSASPTLGTGLDAADFGTIDRADGTKQVTFYGKPLYYFAGDQAAGATNGQGLNGKWFVVDGEGKLVGASAAAPSAAPSSSSSGSYKY